MATDPVERAIALRKKLFSDGKILAVDFTDTLQGRDTSRVVELMPIVGTQTYPFRTKVNVKEIDPLASKEYKTTFADTTQIIDAILMEPRIDLLRVKERRLGESEFLQKYGVDAATVRTTMKTRLEEVAERLRDFDVAAYDGNIIAVRHARDPTEIIEKYIPITGCDVLNVSEGEFVYRMRRETERGVSEIIASRGVGVPSMKKRHSQDYVFDGFQPNFLIDLEHDFVFACFEDPQKAERMVDETMQAIEDETLPPQSYFMTLKPGHDIHEYSLPYQRTKRFKVIDLTGVKKGEKRTFVCVEGEGDEIQFQEVAPGDEEALKSIMPNTEFYAKWLKDAAEKIAKLRKALKAQAKRDKETLPLF
jgi:hypothetical protein